MAVSTPAFAQSSSRSSARTIRDPVATEAIAPRPHSAASLAFKAQAELDHLCDVQLAYACIEQLLDPDRSSDDEEIQIHATRSQFSALLRLLNGELKQRLESVDAALQSVRDALKSGA
ncbi:hypothetical protein QTI17_13640 [Variovorax sp. J31P179]|jgi:hypothetical protein|uniref:hypothetical protein n=1 Tax=Variovorax sp. J31P179 TaxID=3053508 RepID=UPI00257590F4|nr:hypothetical protein [Variovorax sp. J31P179]MDM0081640.1 hypothetical protein [Variovorax sp. J31P179]